MSACAPPQQPVSLLLAAASALRPRKRPSAHHINPYQRPQPPLPPSQDMDSEIRAEVVASEASFLHALRSDSHAQARFATSWQQTVQKISSGLESGQLKEDTARLCHDVARRIGAVAEAFSEWEHNADHIVHSAALETQEHLKVSGCSAFNFQRTSGTFSSPRPQPHVPSRQNPTNQASDPSIAPYRLWFLGHFSWPYLGPADKAYLAKAVPSQTTAQVATWLINSRRRSGWGELFKKYGGDSKDKMEAFIREVDSPTTSWQISDEAKADVEKVRDWFREQDRNVVRSGIAEVLKEVETIGEKVKKHPRETRRGRKPSPQLGMGRPAQDLFPSEPNRNVSDSSIASTNRDFSGLSHFSVDSLSTVASSYYSASPSSFDLSPPPELPFPLPQLLHHQQQPQPTFIYSSSAQAQEPNPYFSTLAEMPYAALPFGGAEVSFS